MPGIENTEMSVGDFYQKWLAARGIPDSEEALAEFRKQRSEQAHAFLTEMVEQGRAIIVGKNDNGEDIFRKVK